MKRVSVCAYVLMRHDTSLPLYAHVHIFDDPSPTPFPYLCKYLMDGLFLNQKTNKNIQISCSLKYKHSKKKSLRKNKWQCRMKYTFKGLIKNPKNSVIVFQINGIIKVPYQSYLNQCFEVSQQLKCDGHIEIFQSHVVAKIFQNLLVRDKFSVR